ncbi:hypothetical protein [Lentzea fradiae]|uniref:5'-methylthioadenosine/S-adenosylhomocysteine nucleosidase family protein n=1 Tax=Lentzea fradiae TaxID=200378 RepID=UPI001FE0CD42|nr:hypothetical protein [Lentzea fradiae]
MSNSAGDVPTLRDCLRAAKAVSASPNSKRVMATVRPRAVGGVVRDRSPLALILYVAALDRRLVWQGIDGFALLEPPPVRPGRTRWWGARHWLLNLADRHWPATMMLAPSLLAFVVALAMTPFPALRLTAVLIAAAPLLWITFLMTGGLVRQVFVRDSSHSDAVALRLLSGENWTMSLFHQDNHQRDDELFDRVRARLLELISRDVRSFGDESGLTFQEAHITGRLVCLHDGVTSDRARSRLAERHPDTTWIEGARFSVSDFPTRRGDAEKGPLRLLSFGRFYVLCVGAVVLILALMLYWGELSACAQRTCAAPVDSYGDAVIWMAYRLVYQEPPGLTAVSANATAWGWMMGLLLPMTAAVVLVASVRKAGQLRRVAVRYNGGSAKARLLVVAVTEVECSAIIDVFEAYTNRTAEVDYELSVPVFRLGPVSDVEVFLVQAGDAGSVDVAAVPRVAGDAIRDLKPSCAVITGICYGLKPKEQDFRQILVSSRIRDLDHAKMLQSGDMIVSQDRGEVVSPSPRLLQAAKTAKRQWERENNVPVHFGQMLSWNKLVNAELVVSDLRERYPDAIGGDMEGTGFYAAVRWAGIEGILIKAISDFGQEKDDSHQRPAAVNAARYVLHLVKVGALTNVGGRRDAGPTGRG